MAVGTAEENTQFKGSSVVREEKSNAVRSVLSSQDHRARSSVVIRQSINDELLLPWSFENRAEEHDEFSLRRHQRRIGPAASRNSILSPPRCPPSKHSSSLLGPIPLVSHSEEDLLTSVRQHEASLYGNPIGGKIVCFPSARSPQLQPSRGGTLGSHMIRS